MRRKEEELYPKVRKWFESWLRARNRDCDIIVEDTHDIKLSRFITEIGGKEEFTLSDTFDIQVDITGIIKKKEIWELGFIEVKVTSLSLRNVGQLLGYCIVASPRYAFLISPIGPNKSITKLINVYGRKDILKYQKNAYIRLGKWIDKRGEIDPQSIIPRGLHD